VCAEFNSDVYAVPDDYLTIDPTEAERRVDTVLFDTPYQPLTRL
jgi:hypothetical protein